MFQGGAELLVRLHLLLLAHRLGLDVAEMDALHHRGELHVRLSTLIVY